MSGITSSAKENNKNKQKKKGGREYGKRFTGINQQLQRLCRRHPFHGGKFGGL